MCCGYKCLGYVGSIIYCFWCYIPMVIQYIYYGLLLVGGVRIYIKDLQGLAEHSLSDQNFFFLKRALTREYIVYHVLYKCLELVGGALQMTSETDTLLQRIAERLVHAICQVFQPMLARRHTIFAIPPLILHQHKRPKHLRKNKANPEADNSRLEARVVAGCVVPDVVG